MLPTYEQRDRRRQSFQLGLGLTVGASLVYGPSRRAVTRGLLGAAEALGARFGRAVPPLPLRTSYRQLNALLEERVPRAARQALRETDAERLLHGELHPFGLGSAARPLARSAALRDFFEGTQSPGSVLGHEELAPYARQLGPGVFGGMLQRTRGALPQHGVEELTTNPGVVRARAEIRRLATQELQQQARAQQPLLNLLGVRPVRLGELHGDLARDEHARELRTFLTGMLGSEAAALPVGGLYAAGDRVYDLRRASDAWRRLRDGVRTHFQIPLAPGAMGLSPFQLGPWRLGVLPSRFAHEGRNAVDPGLRAVLGATGPAIERDVFRVGDHFLAADFTEGAVEELTVRGHFRSGLHGFTRRRTEAVEAAREARASGRPGNLFQGMLGLGRQHGESFFSGARTIMSKFDPASEWAPRVLQRVLGRPLEALEPADVRQAVGFLGAAPLSRKVRTLLGTTAQAGLTAEPELAVVAGALESEAALDAFLRAAGETGTPRRYGPELERLLGHYRADPAGFYARHQPAVDRDLLGWNFLGKPEPSGPLDQLREALTGELARRLNLLDEGEAARLIRSAPGLSRSEREAALAWAHGRTMERRLLDPGYADSSQHAAAWLRGDPLVQQEAETYTRRAAPAWETHIPESPRHLRTAELFMRDGTLATFNRARAEGRSWSEAMREATGALWQGTSAFFTGNPAQVTSDTLFLDYFPRRLNDLFAEVGLGLAPEDLGSGGRVLGALLAKRVLPAAAAVEAYRYADYKGEQWFGAGPSDAYANVRGNLGQLRAQLAGDRLPGLGRRELFPGLDLLLPDRNPEEEAEHQRTGREPVRKGRFWFLGSRTPLQGEKIDYYLPSAVNAARSDWQQASNAGLSDASYWAHSALPTAENLFLGPIGPALFDPYAWEREHATGPNPDRPYLVTGPRFDPGTLHGPLLNALLGWTKPRQVLAPEYVPEAQGGSASRDELTRINQRMRLGLDRKDLGIILGGGGVGSGGGGGAVGEYGGQLYSPGIVGAGAPASETLSKITPGGDLKVYGTRGGAGAWAGWGHSTKDTPGLPAGKRLSHRELERLNRLTRAGGSPLMPMRGRSLAQQREPFAEEDLDLIDYEHGGITGARHLADLTGLYGYLVETALPFDVKQDGLVIPDPSRAYGFNKRFYDLSAGGFGGPLSEVGRRFLPKRQRFDSWEPQPNNMPSWLPSSEYFLDFRHGDIISKIPRGLMRLPGEAFERLHPELKLMQARASSLGHSVTELMQEMLHLEEPLSEFGEQVTETGNQFHLAIQRQWQRMGVLLGAEFKLENAELGISGHPDAVLASRGGPLVTDIKTVSNKRFQLAKKQPFAEHVSQLSFYMHELGLQQGSILYVNRDKPWELHQSPVRYSERTYQEGVARVQEARRRLTGMISAGTISRGELYDPVTRFEVLGDVAQYSDNYAELRAHLTEQNKAGQLSPEENARFQAAKKRVARQKKRVEPYPYRFRGKLRSETVTVDQILDPNTFSIRESENPIRLAGIRSSGERIDDILGAGDGTPAERQFAHFGIQPGSRVKVLLETDPQAQVADDVLKTQHAVVLGRGGNVNRQLLGMGIGTEKEGDWSDTGVEARFSHFEQFKGQLWEGLAHLDTPVHSKLLKVRSPLEELERSIVFGKSTGGWQDPVRDYVWPTLESYAARNPVAAGVGLGVFSTFFVKTPAGKKAALAAGTVAGVALSLLRLARDAISDTPWKPRRTRVREELEEYWDKLSYLKSRNLAAREEQLALRLEKTDVARLVEEQQEEGNQRDRIRKSLEKRKRRLILDSRKKHRDELAEIQEQLDRLEEPQGALKLGPHGTRALLHRQKYGATLHGLDPSTSPFLDVFRAFPKYKRELLQGFINQSDPAERERIYQLLPRGEQRAIGRYLGKKPEELPEAADLGEYFREHPLPDANWAGWSPEVNLESLRQRAIKGEGLDPFESGLYPIQIEQAEEETADIPVPTLEGRSVHIKETLSQLLAGKGFRNLRVDVQLAHHDGPADDFSVDLHVRHRREKDLAAALQLYG